MDRNHKLGIKKKLLPIIFLDRDGTIIVDKIYLNNPDEVEFIEGVIPGLKKLVDKGFKLVIVTNQSGIARGLVKVKNIDLIHKKIVTELNKNGIKIFRIYYCPHLPSDNCDCRKPKTGMVKDLLPKIDLSNSYIIGDKKTDIDFGKNLGIKTILLKSNIYDNSCCAADYTAEKFYAAVEWIINIGVRCKVKSER